MMWGWAAPTGSRFTCGEQFVCWSRGSTFKLKAVRLIASGWISVCEMSKGGQRSASQSSSDSLNHCFEFLAHALHSASVVSFSQRCFRCFKNIWRTASDDALSSKQQADAVRDKLVNAEQLETLRLAKTEECNTLNWLHWWVVTLAIRKWSFSVSS